MKSRSFDLLVVGAGAVGAAVFHELVARLSPGHSVGLIERKRVGLGVTAYSGGIVRCFHAQPRLTVLARDSYTYFCEFAERTGSAAQLVQTGQLYFLSSTDKLAARAEVAGLAPELGIELLSVSEARRVCPSLRPGRSEDAEALVAYEPGAGYMDPIAVTRAWVEAGVRAGGALMEGVAMTSFVITSSRVCGVNTNIGPIHARQIVLCVGPQLPTLLNAMSTRPDHTFFAKAIEVFQVEVNGEYRGHPAFTDDVYGLNGRSCADGSMLVGLPTDDRDYSDGDQQPDFSRVKKVLQTAALRFDWADGARVRSGFRAFDAYASTGVAQPQFVDEHEALIVPSVLNGGAFKFAPAIAHEVAQLVCSNERKALLS